MNLKRMIPSAGPLILILIVVCPLDAGDNSPLKANVSANYYSKYIWRGQNVNDTSVFQPYISGSIHGFTGSVWGNMDLTDGSQTAPENGGRFSEVNYTLDYSASVPGTKRMGFSLGTIHYRFPHTDAESTTEIYGALSCDVLLKPRLVWYRDVDEVDGSYIQCRHRSLFEKALKWNKDYYVDLLVGGSVAWGLPATTGGISGSTAAGSTILPCGERPRLAETPQRYPHLQLSSLLSESIGNATFERNNIWFGIGFSKSF